MRQNIQFNRGFSFTVSIHASVKDATLYLNIDINVSNGFNPRICKRCDDSVQLLDDDSRVSIHASVKDATSLNFNDLKQYVVSIHASVKDATYLHLEKVHQKEFQSTHL